MDNELPKRTSSYAGRLTDTSRWDSYRARADDILICTPPKCGTTWTQAICALLIFETSEFKGKLTNISPWFDSKLESLDVCVTTLESQVHRRFVKTHTPLDGVPYFPSCEYLIVYRDPKDAYFSIRNHLLNMIDPPNIPQLASDEKAGFRAWLDTPFEPGLGEQRSLEAFAYHFESYSKFRHLKNFHFFHYADMQRDLRANVRRIASILDFSIADGHLDEVCNAATFTAMKKRASSFAPASGKPYFKSDTAFFNSGRNAQWHDVLGTEEIERYNVRINALLSPENIYWLENGSKEQRDS